MPEFLVGLSGYAGSGKDAAAQALVDGGWRRDAFADRLKRFLYNLDPLIPAYPDTPPFRLSKVVDAWGWDQAKVKFPEVRALLQRCGTDAGREVLGSTVWIDALFRDHVHTPALVISDVRFGNEARAIADRGGVLIRVTRPGVGPKASRGGLIHESEVALDDWPFDHDLTNDGTIADLHSKLLGVALLAEHKFAA